MMDAGDFRTPFFLMAACYLIANLLLWQFFAGREKQLVLAPVATASD